MTAAEELEILEAQYEAWIRAGMPQSYTTGDGRTFTRANFETIVKRIDHLRAQSARGTGSGFSAADFRADH